MSGPDVTRVLNRLRVILEKERAGTIGSNGPIVKERIGSRSEVVTSKPETKLVTHWTELRDMFKI